MYKKKREFFFYHKNLVYEFATVKSKFLIVK